jgi:predicted Zn-dependent protease
MRRILIVLVIAVPLAAQTRPQPGSQDSISQRIAELIEQRLVIVNDSETNDYLNQIARNISRKSNVFLPVVKLVKDDSVDTQAIEDVLYVNTGLIRKVENEAELAAAVANAMAGIVLRRGSTLPMVRLAGHVETTPLPPSGTIMSPPMLDAGRYLESDGDIQCLLYLEKAGYDPSGFVTLLKKVRVDEKSKKDPREKAYAARSTTENRIAEAQKYIKKKLKPRPDYLVTTPEFTAMKARFESQ